MIPPSTKSFVLASANKDTKLYSDFEILKYLKKTNPDFSEENINNLAPRFSIDISHMRSLLYTKTRSHNWI